MRLHSVLLSSFVLLSLSTAACNFKLGDKTEGEKGNLTFAYDGPGCFFGCGLDRSALQGSLVTVSATGGDPDVRPTARITQSSVARVSEQHESCSCQSQSNGHGSSRSIEPSGTCASGEEKKCSLSVDIETSQQGDATLEITGPTGSVVDRVTVHVRPAARIDVNVTQGATKKGDVYEVQNGFKVKLESHVYADDGQEALFTKHGVAHDYADKSIVGPDSSVLIGSTNVEDMIANGTGETTVKVHAPGAEQVVRFRVVP